jgi:hypothetical protein
LSINDNFYKLSPHVLTIKTTSLRSLQSFDCSKRVRITCGDYKGQGSVFNGAKYYQKMLHRATDSAKLLQVVKGTAC